nr:uncharacterized protein LOC110073821 [Pogona vitticeps]
MLKLSPWPNINGLQCATQQKPHPRPWYHPFPFVTMLGFAHQLFLMTPSPASRIYPSTVLDCSIARRIRLCRTSTKCARPQNLTLPSNSLPTQGLTTASINPIPNHTPNINTSGISHTGNFDLISETGLPQPRSHSCLPFVPAVQLHVNLFPSTRGRNNWFIIIDLQDAYFHISIHPSHQKYLRFHFNDAVFQYCSLPFRFSTAPRTFTKCVAPIITYLRLHGITIYPYINDWLIVTPSYHDAIATRDFTLITLQRLRLTVNVQKSHLQPKQTALFIGAHINSLQAKAFLPHERFLKIKDSISFFRTHQTVPAH